MTNKDRCKLDYSEQAFLSRRIPIVVEMHDKLSQNLSQGLSAFIKTPCSFNRRSLKSRLFLDYVQRYLAASPLYSVEVSPLDSRMFILLDKSLVYRALERAYGGVGNAPMQTSSNIFTAMETAIIQPLMMGLCRQLDITLEPILPLKFSLNKEKLSAADVAAYPPQTLMVSCTLEFSIKEQILGQLTLLWPYDLWVTLQSIRQGGQPIETTHATDSVSAVLNQIIVDIKATLNNTNISLSEIPHWKVGDLLPIEFSEESTLSVASVPLFKAKLGNAAGKYALKIVEKIR